jgi:outer membrane DcaP-like protein
VKGSVVTKTLIRRFLSCALIAFASGLSVRASADEASDLRQLKSEVEAERRALADERQALAEQRRRIDEALLNLQDQKNETARAQATGQPLPPVGAPSEGKGKDEPHLDVYGFIHTDAIYDLNRVDPAWNATLRPSKIPVTCPGDPGCGQDGETILSVRQSRLGFKGYLPTPLGEMKTWFEFDLFGVGVDAGNTTMRIRHIWGELGSWGAGQTNSLFMDGDVFPNVIDYWGPAGMLFLRNPQVRWTPVYGDHWRVALALEAPGAGIDAGKAALVDPALVATPWNMYPDFTSQVRYSDDWGHLQLGTLFRSIGVEGTTGTGDLFHRRTFGWGLSLSNVLQMGALLEGLRGDQLLTQLVFGEGIANYMNDGGNDIGPTSGGRIAAVPTVGWTIYYNRSWSDRWTTSLGYSQHLENPVAGQLGTAFESGSYMNVNVLYHPLPEMFLGPEFIWGKRKNEDSNGGSDSRVQFSFHYDFAGSIRPR